MQLFAKWMLAASVLVGSLSMAVHSNAAVVALNAVSGTGVFKDDGQTGELGFSLPANLASIQNFSLTINFETDTSALGFGTATIQVYLEQDTAALAPPPPGRGAFALGETSGLAHGATISPVYNAAVGASSATLSGSFLQSQFNFGPLSATGLWDDFAGSTYKVFFYVSGTNEPTSVSVRANSATMSLTYNETAGGGAVPEPSTLAIALVGLAGWRGRRMLRRC
jgi:hypothetical protein